MTPWPKIFFSGLPWLSAFSHSIWSTWSPWGFQSRHAKRHFSHMWTVMFQSSLSIREIFLSFYAYRYTLCRIRNNLDQFFKSGHGCTGCFINCVTISIRQWTTPESGTEESRSAYVRGRAQVLLNPIADWIQCFMALEIVFYKINPEFWDIKNFWSIF